MEFKGMDELLQKYYNGETSLEEERTIKGLLKDKKSSNPDEELISYFNNYKDENPVPFDLGSDINNSLNYQIGKRLMRKKVLNSVLYGMAAGLMLIFVIRNLVINGDVGVESMGALANIEYCEESSKCETEVFEMASVLDYYGQVDVQTIISYDIIAVSKSVSLLLKEYSAKDEVEAIFINSKNLNESNIEFPNEEIKKFLSSADEIFILKIKDNLQTIDRFLIDINDKLSSNFILESNFQSCVLFSSETQKDPEQRYYVMIMEGNLFFYNINS